MKYILTVIIGLGVAIGTLSTSTPDKESSNLSSAERGFALEGYCRLSPEQAAEAAMIEAVQNEARLHGMDWHATQAPCADLQQLRSGHGHLVRMTHLLQHRQTEEAYGEFAVPGANEWNGSQLSLALDKELAAVLDGAEGGDIGLQVNDGWGRYRISIEPAFAPEASRAFVGLTLAAQSETGPDGKRFLLMISEPYQDPQQALGLYEKAQSVMRQISSHQAGS